VSRWFAWSVFGVLCSLEAEMAGDLLAEGAVLGSQAGVLCAGGIEPLAERVGGCALRGGPAGGWLKCPLPADEVADLVLAVEPSSGDAGCLCDRAEAHWPSLALQLLYGMVCGLQCRLVAPGVGLGEERRVVSAGHRRGRYPGAPGGRG
jgi:hypothetical protein